MTFTKTMLKGYKILVASERKGHVCTLTDFFRFYTPFEAKQTVPFHRLTLRLKMMSNDYSSECFSFFCCISIACISITHVSSASAILSFCLTSVKWIYHRLIVLKQTMTFSVPFSIILNTGSNKILKQKQSKLKLLKKKMKMAIEQKSCPGMTNINGYVVMEKS